MTVQTINIDDILLEKSLFSLDNFLFEESLTQDHLAQSLNRLGIVNPVTLYQDKSGKLHLIDGKKRVIHARQKQTKEIDSVVLPEGTPIDEIINLIFTEKRTVIEGSVMNKIGFISFALSLSITESWIFDSLCRPLGLKPHSAFLDECRGMHDLPRELKRFCHEKRFSLKQILNLTHCPEDLLLQIVNWQSILHLSASILDEITSNLKHYLKAQNKKIEDFVAEPEVREIIDSDLPPREKTGRLRYLIYTKRYPILSGVNAQIQRIVEDVNLPQEISINWDKTLENKRLAFVVQVQDSKAWKDVIDKLSSEQIEDAVQSILNEL